MVSHSLSTRDTNTNTNTNTNANNNNYNNNINMNYNNNNNINDNDNITNSNDTNDTIANYSALLDNYNNGQSNNNNNKIKKKLTNMPIWNVHFKILNVLKPKAITKYRKLYQIILINLHRKKAMTTVAIATIMISITTIHQILLIQIQTILQIWYYYQLIMII